MSRIDLPDELGPVFRTRDARRIGIGEGRLRAGDLERPFHGVRAVAEREEPEELDGPATPEEESGPSIRLARNQRRRILRAVRRYTPRMTRHEFFSHSTAAVIWGVPLPLAVLPDDELHVSVLAPVRAGRAAGVHGHEAQPALTRVVQHPVMRVALTSPATTWAMLGAQLRHPYDIVAAADHLVRVPRMPGGFDKPMPPAIATMRELEAALFAGRRVGKPLLRTALPLVRQGSSSRPETWTRLIIIDAGLPEPVLDHDVYASDGSFIGCVDLAYPELKIAIEYEGDHHRTDTETWNRDILKHDRLAAEGWRVIRVTRDMVFAHPETLAARVREAIRTRG
jgi:hypothetical protein